MPEFLALLLAAGEVDVEEDEVVFGVVGPLGGGKDLAVHELAPAAPVGAGELDEEGLAGLLGEFLGGGGVAGPLAELGALFGDFGGGGRGGDDGGGGDDAGGDEVAE